MLINAKMFLIQHHVKLDISSTINNAHNVHKQLLLVLQLIKPKLVYQDIVSLLSEVIVLNVVQMQQIVVVLM